MEKKDILSLSYGELCDALGEYAKPAYRVSQLYDWLHVKCVDDFALMTNLPKTFLLHLYDNFVIFSCSIEKKLVSMYDDTVKYLFRLSDGEYVEAVVMRYRYGSTVCISTQVGCKMGCAFCASGIGGLVRSLKPSEMLSQVYTAQRDLGQKMSHIVLMGMGEPLDNFDNTIKFLRLINDDKGQNVSMRKISLSTSGIVPRIEELMKLNLGITLSVSLHAPSDELRSAIMPVNRKWGVEQLLEVCRRYAGSTSRRISFEYTLIDGVNDSDDCALMLASKLRGMLCHVNLIPVNTVNETGLKQATNERTRAFAAVLSDKGINCTVRRTLGSDINASCGQLRKRTENSDRR